MTERPYVGHDPVDRLTHLCAAMTDHLDAMVATEQGLDPSLPDVRCVVLISDPDRGGIVIHGYDDQNDALVDMFLHLKAMFAAQGKELHFAGIPNSPEGL